MDRYEKALELARAYYDKDANAFLDTIFPELKEIRDEQIRKAIIKSLDVPFPEDNLPGTDVTYEEAIAYLEKKKEPILVPDKFSGLKSLMLQYLQSAANRKDDAEIESDTDLWGRKILDYVWKYDEKQKEQKPRKFRLGDKVHWHDDDTNIITITGFRDDAYLTDSACGPILFGDENNWEIAEQKPAEVDESTKRLNDNWMKQHFDDYEEQKSAQSREEILHQLFQSGSITLSDYLYLTGEQKPAEKEITLTSFEGTLNTFLFDFANSPIEDCEPKEYIKKHSAEILKAAYKELNAKLQQDIFEARQEGIRDGYEVAKAEQKPAEIAPNQFDGITYGMQGYSTEKPMEWSEDWREEDIQTRFAFYTYKDEDGVLYLSNVFVEEASRNHGFGTKILIAAEKVAETIGATTISLKVKQDSPANAWYRKNGYGYVAFEDGYDWLEKNLEYMKPNKQGWSEEDEKMLGDIIRYLEVQKEDRDAPFFDLAISFLKSLRPSWKPSEEQMKALLNAEGFLRAGLQYDSAKAIAVLYEQLKQL